MRKILLLTILSLASLFGLRAQQTAKYTVWFTNGSSIDCLSFQNTEDGNLQVERMDGKTAIYSMELVDRVTPAGRQGIETSQANPSAAAQQRIGTAATTSRPTTSTSGRGGAKSGNFTARPGSAEALYSHEYGWVRVVPRKDPFVAGLASGIIPGLGQFYNGDVGIGFAFMGSWLAMGTGAYFCFNGDSAAAGVILSAGAVASWVWAILHASDTAKKINLARGYALGGGQYLDIRPAVTDTRTLVCGGYNYGVSIGLVF